MRSFTHDLAAARPRPLTDLEAQREIDRQADESRLEQLRRARDAQEARLAHLLGSDARRVRVLDR
jgi:hypothetical protein